MSPFSGRCVLVRVERPNGMRVTRGGRTTTLSMALESPCRRSVHRSCRLFLPPSSSASFLLAPNVSDHLRGAACSPEGRKCSRESSGASPCSPLFHTAASNSLRYRTPPPIMPIFSRLRNLTMNTSSGIPSHWLLRPYRLAGANPNLG